MLNQNYEFRWYRESKDKPARLQYKHKWTVLEMDTNLGHGGMIPKDSGWCDIPVVNEYIKPSDEQQEHQQNALKVVMDAMNTIYRDKAVQEWRGWPGSHMFAVNAILELEKNGYMLSVDEFNKRKELDYDAAIAMFERTLAPVLMEKDEERRRFVNYLWNKKPSIFYELLHVQPSAQMLSGGVMDCSKPNYGGWATSTQIQTSDDLRPGYTGAVFQRAFEPGSPAPNKVIQGAFKGELKFQSPGVQQARQVTTDMCDQGHRFAKLPDHPLRDGRPRCVHCLAIGFDLLSTTNQGSN